MRNNKASNYGEFSRRYQQEGHEHHSGRFHGQSHAYLGDTRAEPGEYYRLQQSRQYGRSGGRVGNQDERYEEMYDIANYTDQPRSVAYGQRYDKPESNLDDVEYFPYAEGPYAGRPRHYTYTQGYNPNYDNPEEGDMYRDFDSRGNHGFRHEASYGNTDEFLDFGNDHYGRHDRTNQDRNYGHFGGYNR